MIRITLYGGFLQYANTLGPTPRAPETGGLKGIWSFANYLKDPWVIQEYKLGFEASV